MLLRSSNTATNDNDSLGSGTPSILSSRFGGSEDSIVPNVIAAKEQRYVAVSKMIMGLVLVIAATTMAASTYRIIKRAEIREFEREVGGVYGE